MLSEREKEILEALKVMGIGRLDTETFPTWEVEDLLWKGLRALEEKEEVEDI